MTESEELYEDEVQSLIDLTEPQKKAWSALVRALNRCKKEDIFLYQVLDTLGALNGKNVESVENIEETNHTYGSPRDLNTTLRFPTVHTTCSWADDTHVVLLECDNAIAWSRRKG